MTTLTKITIAVVLSILLMSCNFDLNLSPGVNGNGNVQTIERILEDDFNQIEVSRGIDVYLTQSDRPMLKVQADENLHNIIITEIDNGVLKIYADENISSSESKKVMVNVNTLDLIGATSGSHVYTTNTIETNSIKLNSTSGAHIEIDLDVQSTALSSTSGSFIKVSGRTIQLSANATSGANIKTKSLITQNCTASVTSGANIVIYAEEKLTASASSGGNISYHGDPKSVSKSAGVSGSIRKL
ncbi:Putative auto-transporter adhesin, head GIN domain [Formosa sp. Hel1_31_208]|uniref:head GIN domain-containing protein n=1 Tax=Formosa sp. Hel1_31_208 TaxID=1798225 RepID=UPI00087DC5CC|nr:head GIN domain-containing protein [Formosa sp. Hel1_31_208]SDS62350.1 Putative auto-transporter adhesin, head GIN domain [Formosa sp. Hel1_31_208]